MAHPKTFVKKFRDGNGSGQRNRDTDRNECGKRKSIDWKPTPNQSQTVQKDHLIEVNAETVFGNHGTAPDNAAPRMIGEK